MNSRIFVRATGTPTFRAATGSPPALKIQLPKRVRASTQAATTVKPSHQSTATLSPYRSQTVEANSRCAKPNPGAWSMSLIETPPVILIVSSGVQPAQHEERPERDDEAREPRLDDGDAVEEADRQAEQDHDDDRRPDVPVRLRGQDSQQQARAADHDARREVELPADHQERDRHGDDAVVRGGVEPAAPDAGIAGPVDLLGPSRRRGGIPRRRR